MSRPSVTEKGKWMPKLTDVVEKGTLVEDHASTSNTIRAKDKSTRFNSLTIKERAFKLQSQLFGMYSI